MTAQPSLDARQIRRNAFKLAMSVGNSNKYRIMEITGRHFIEIGKKARIPQLVIRQALQEIRERGDEAFDRIERKLPRGFPEPIHASVKRAATARLHQLERVEFE